MKEKSAGKIVLVGIICIVIGVGGTYLFEQQEISNLKTNHINEKDYLDAQILALNDDLENDKEFNRFYSRVMKEYSQGLLNEGLARAYNREADFSYNTSLYGWAESYYTLAGDYFNFAKDAHAKAIVYLKQAKYYITNDKTMDFIDTFLDYLNASKERYEAEYNYVDDLRLACYYYNLSEWEKGNEKLDDANVKVEELNSLIDAEVILYDRIDVLLSITWKD